MFPYIAFVLVTQLNMLAIFKIVDVKLHAFGCDQSIVVSIVVV